VLGPLLFLLYTSDLFSVLENDLVGYADDSTLIAEISSPVDRASVSQSLERDLVRVSDWCSLWCMKLNTDKTKTMLVSRSRTVNPPAPALYLDGVELKNVKSLVILGVTFDSKLTFEEHLRLVSKSVSQRIGILRKSWKVFRDSQVLLRCFNCFLLPVLEYCSAVWCSAADSHLKLPDRAVAGAKFLVGEALSCDLGHRREVAALCMLFKIWKNPMHPLCGFLPQPYVPARVTRGALAKHSYAFEEVRARTGQFGRSFVPFSVSLWNCLNDSVFDGVGLDGFKSRVHDHLLAL